MPIIDIHRLFQTTNQPHEPQPAVPGQVNVDSVTDIICNGHGRDWSLLPGEQLGFAKLRQRSPEWGDLDEEEGQLPLVPLAAPVGNQSRAQRLALSATETKQR